MIYDLSQPRLVFVTQCHHPVTEKFTGYLFKWFQLDRVRELFFEDHASAHLFAARTGSELMFDEKAAPEVVTAEGFTECDYVEPYPTGGAGLSSLTATAATYLGNGEGAYSIDAQSIAANLLDAVGEEG